ncbi:hypothetical protein BS78_07G068300 [Paspalum vaginatum]|nr:hypothetical protein BS78_07G068300 [Paspalum vaginatum]
MALSTAAVLAALIAGVSCSDPDLPPGPNVTTDYDGRWLPARATWYGRPTGAGPDDNGGACGIKDVNLPPYGAMTSCGNIKCSAAAECSGEPVVVFITDMNYGHVSPYYFDLSGTAFGSMAKPGVNDQLRHRGIIDLDFRRVPCKYPGGQNIVFHVEEGSNPFYLAVLVKRTADLKEKASPEWEPMKHSRGAIWRTDTVKVRRGPFSVRLTSESGKVLVATDVIPENWQPNTVYNSNIQF